MSAEEAKLAQKSYHIFTAGNWYFPLMLAVYLPSFIGFWFVADSMEGMDEWLVNATGIIMLILTYPLVHYIARFEDADLTDDKFQLELTNGEVFRIQPITRWWGSDEEFEALVRDFKAQVKALNPDGTKDTIAYQRKWFSGTLGKGLLALAVCGIPASIALFIAVWLKQDGFSWDLLIMMKLPIFMLIFSVWYIMSYYSDGSDSDG